MPNKVKDLTGQRFGKLTVIERCGSTNSKHKVALWLCKCDCGNEVKRTGSHLKSNYINSCGSCRDYRHDLTGKRFGRWTVLERAENKHNKISYVCICDCGKTKTVNADTLLNGRSLSCGCLQKERVSEMEIKHGMANTRIYRIYYNMKSRCLNHKDDRYKDYGGRGISICKEWLDFNGFENFCEWSMNNGYLDNLTIDRINVNGNYEPSNCRWITNAEQSKNKRTCIYFTYFGVTKNLKDWCECIGESYKKIYGRHYRGYEAFRKEDVEKIKKYLENGGN